MRSLCVFILAAFLLAAGCSAPLRVDYSAKAAHAAQKPLNVHVGDFKDQRLLYKNTQKIGDISATVSDMSARELIITESIPELVRKAFILELQALGHDVVDSAEKADVVIDGEIKNFELEIGSRDRVNISIMTEIRRTGGEAVWAGEAKEEGERYAGVMGNSRETISSYISASLSKAIKSAIGSISGINESERNEVEGQEPSLLGKAQIKSDPGRARVYLNGVYYGLTPIELEIEPGIYELVIKKEGFIDAAERISIRKKSLTEIDIRLERQRQSNIEKTK